MARHLREFNGCGHGNSNGLNGPSSACRHLLPARGEKAEPFRPCGSLNCRALLRQLGASPLSPPAGRGSG
ncbi:unnamed protein product [Ciceribacter selenitireducens ATCC BAA-1503]|uniref:Uncharacterized protein n=1 Tax=Ciceribacter selenitireducens ATCC BAA-1503 TaxID=1336235 RepID=A0A376AIA2_9HYPH|nr:unnamed protein product [Ciceribacter selenitireducens ATCC BAA-1503]